MSLIKYIITDDHKIFRQGLRMALADDHKLKLVGEAGTGIELLQLLKNTTPDVILLDIKMPELGGIEALPEIKRMHPDIKVLVLTMFDDETFILHLMEAGANGYLLKNAEPDEIKTALHCVYQNEFYFNDLVSTAMLRKIAKNTKTPPRFSAIKLNDKEAQILRLICMEYTASEIAKEVFLSQRTVEGIRSVLLEKTGARNTAGLVLFAVKSGIFTD